MRIDKKFLARLLGVPESDIPSVSGMSFKLDNSPDGVESFKGLIHDRTIKRIKALMAVLQKEDDLGKVVRGHIHIEHELHDFVFFAAPSPDQLKRFDKMEFADKVEVALVLGLSPELRSPLNSTGALRNKFAHQLDMKIGEQETKNLIATLSPVAKQRLQAHLQTAFSAAPSASLLTEEQQSHFRAQIQLLAFFVRLFDEVAEERHRVAFEKLQRMAWH